MNDFRHYRYVAALVSAVALSCSVSPAYIDGLSFQSGSGQSLRVSRKGADGSASVYPENRAIFLLEKPVTVDGSDDIAVMMRGVGSVDVVVFAKADGMATIASGSYVLLEGLAAEFVLDVPSGARVGAIGIRAGKNSSATVSAFSTKQGVRGARFDDGRYLVDDGSSVVLASGANPVSVTIRLGTVIDASIVVALASDGTATITGAGGSSVAFEAEAKAGASVAIPLVAFGVGATEVTINSSAGIVSATIVEGGGAPLSDLYALLGVPESAGDYALYRWDLFPYTLVLDFADYAAQDRYFKRLAFFAEKPGFRGRLADDDEIAGLHGWNAHDYSTATLAAFYTKAADSGFSLNSDELAFLELLVSYGILRRDAAGTLREGRGAVVSICRESTPSLRRVFIDHESSHALYFQEPGYRALSARLWAGLAPESRRFWYTHFAWRRYDIADKALCVNEMQAYLVQQAVSSTRAYYEAVIARLSEEYPAEQARLEADAPAALDAAAANAAILDRYLRDAYGVSAGRFGRTRVIRR